jgi:hypothetical protein
MDMQPNRSTSTRPEKTWLMTGLLLAGQMGEAGTETPLSTEKLFI